MTVPNWSLLPATTPPGIRALLRRCLQKDANKRLRSASDIAIAIEDILNAPATSGMASAPVWKRALPWGVTVFLSIVVGLAAWSLKPAADSGANRLLTTRFAVALPPGELLPLQGEPPGIAISPDGAQIAYSSIRGATRQI